MYSISPLGVVGISCFLYRSGFALYTSCILGAFWLHSFLCLIYNLLLLIKKKKKTIHTNLHKVFMLYI